MHGNLPRLPEYGGRGVEVARLVRVGHENAEPVRIDGFGGRGPGESPGLALRTAEITAPAATARRMLAFVRAQRSPYLATRADLTSGPDGYVLTIEFGAPAPLGMLR